MPERRTRGTSARASAHRPASPSGRAGARSAVASGSLIDSISTASSPTARPVPTRSTFQLLLARGLGADDAANLIAYLCGIAVHDRPWTLAEVNRLLFLRELVRTGRSGVRDDRPRIH